MDKIIELNNRYKDSFPIKNIPYKYISETITQYLSLSHGNADPERGFNINKLLLGNREQLKPDTITAIRVVRDAISIYNKVEDFPINRRLLDLCASARQKYFLHLDVEKQQKELELKEKQNQAKEDDIRKKKAESNVKVQKLETLLAEEALKLKVADRLIDEKNESLSSLVKAQMVLSSGIERSKEINKTIDRLNNEIKDISTK